MITELLGDRTNKKTARELASITGLTKREVERRIELERKAGAPICASDSPTDAGYFIGDLNEIENQCRKFEVQIRGLCSTLKSMRLTAQKMREQGGVYNGTI